MTSLGKLPQTAVYWRANGTNNNGEFTVDLPVEIKCRWEIERRESINEKADPVATSDIITVDRRIPEGSILWLGTIDEYEELVSTTPAELRRVSSYTEGKNLRGTKVYREVSTVKHGNTLPESTGLEPTDGESS